MVQFKLEQYKVNKQHIGLFMSRVMFELYSVFKSQNMKSPLHDLMQHTS
jgi:hypothetical protein